MKCVAIISYSDCALFGDGVTLRSGGEDQMLTFLRPFGGKAERRYVSRSLCPVGVKYEFCLFVSLYLCSQKRLKWNKYDNAKGLL